MKEEQRRLDRLRAEKVQLIGCNDSTKLGFINRTEGDGRQANSTNPATSSKPIDLNMNSLIVDPKSFPIDKKEVLSVDQVNNFVENPDVFSKALKRKPATKSNRGPAKHLPQ